jgi:hypothetical protein
VDQPPVPFISTVTPKLLRVSEVLRTDVIDLVLDFHHKPSMDIIHGKSMYRFMVSYVEQIVKVSCPSFHV